MCDLVGDVPSRARCRRVPRLGLDAGRFARRARSSASCSATRSASTSAPGGSARTAATPRPDGTAAALGRPSRGGLPCSRDRFADRPAPSSGGRPPLVPSRQERRSGRGAARHHRRRSSSPRTRTPSSRSTRSWPRSSAAAHHVNRYPDHRATALRAAIARRLDVDDDQVAVGQRVVGSAPAVVPGVRRSGRRGAVPVAVVRGVPGVHAAGGG